MHFKMKLAAIPEGNHRGIETSVPYKRQISAINAGMMRASQGML
jgi:hypothetical protein